MAERDDSESTILATLREKADRLERLEGELAALEQEREDLLNSKNRLSRKLKKYHRSLEEWEWFFEHSVQMLCIAGLDGYFRRVNATFANTLGYTREELLARLVLSGHYQRYHQVVCHCPRYYRRSPQRGGDSVQGLP